MFMLKQILCEIWSFLIAWRCQGFRVVRCDERSVVSFYSRIHVTFRNTRILNNSPILMWALERHCGRYRVFSLPSLEQQSSHLP
jgi:hypothetical protein